VPAYFTSQEMAALEREQSIARSRADEFLGHFANRHGATEFTTEIIEGLPTPTLLDAAGHVDLVVMGTHGRRGPARWWLGSVAERVIHDSPAPVLVVRAASGTPPEDVFLHPMQVADGRGPDARVAHVAAELAGAVGGEVALTAAACAADLAAERRASLIVLSSAGRHGMLLSHPAEQWLRSCTLPMLFVPQG
jgi:nucleotide-binding universal stress UspA family protein